MTILIILGAYFLLIVWHALYKHLLTIVTQYSSYVRLKTATKIVVFLLSPLIMFSLFTYCLTRLILSKVIRVDFYGRN